MQKEHRIINWLHTALILSAMFFLLYFIGDLLFGLGLMFWLVAFAVLAMLFLPKSNPYFLMKLYRAQNVPHQAAPGLYKILNILSAKAGLETAPDLFVIPSSDRNAFTAGHKDNAVIALNEGLLRNLSSREIAGVLAHEISHLMNGDLVLMNLADMMTRVTSVMANIGILLVMLNLPLILLGYAPAPWLAVLLLVVSPWISTLLQLALSRTREFDADASAAELTGDPRGLANALSKLNPDLHPFWSRLGVPISKHSNPSLLRTHPEASERISRLMGVDAISEPVHRGITDQRTMPAMQIVVRRPKRHWSGIWY